MQVVGFGDVDGTGLVPQHALVRHGKMAFVDKDLCRQGASSKLSAYADMKDKMCFTAVNGMLAALELAGVPALSSCREAGPLVLKALWSRGTVAVASLTSTPTRGGFSREWSPSDYTLPLTKENTPSSLTSPSSCRGCLRW